MNTSIWLNEKSKQNEEIIFESMFRTRCCVPAIVQSYNSLNNTVECQIAIREQMVNPKDGSTQYIQLPLLINVPVVFPGNAFYGIKFPLNQGDEVLVVFSDLSIDNFWLKGGIQNPIEARRHDLSDGIAIPCNLSLTKNTPQVLELSFYQNGRTITFTDIANLLDRE